MKDRILKILKDESLTYSRFADEIGVQRSSVSHILSGRNNPSIDFMQKVLLRFRNINSEWLMLGRGNMYKENITSPSIFPEEEMSGRKVITPPVSQTDIEPENIEIPVVSSNIERIVIFYNNGIFTEYIPGKK